MNTIVRFIVLTLLLGLLAGCSRARPPEAIVEKAIALQLSQVQQNLGEQLYRGTPTAPEMMIQRVKVLDRQPIDIENQRAYEVQGTYDVTLKFADHRTTQRHNSFDLYLRPQLDQTWQLLRPSSLPNQATTWVATPIDPPALPVMAPS